MKTFRKNSRLLLVCLATVITIIATVCVNPAWARKGSGSGVSALSEPEAVMLTYMREEEKLARDVYLAMYEVWGAAIFSTISDSEQRHMDTMKKMIDKYNLPDPVVTTIGLFTNQDLQGKHDDLVAAGSLSYIGGLYVGATIEEIDMVDIQHALDITSHVDLLNSYQHLLEGSKNHLRAYVAALAAQGASYSPQFISQELFDAIISQ